MLDDDTRKSGLYLIRLSDRHYYGGRSQDCSSRWRSHLLALRRGIHKNKYMQAVFNLNRRFEPTMLLEIDAESEQMAKEQEWLDAHYGQPGCVNLSKSADSGMMRGRKHTEETKAKFRARRHSLETRALLSRIGKGRKLTFVHRKAISAGNTGKKMSKHFCQLLSERSKARVWTEEQRRHHSEVHQGFKVTPETKVKMAETRASRLDLVAKARASLERNRIHKGERKSPEAVLKIRKAAAARRGVPQSPEAIAKRVAAITGRKNTEETKALMSESAKRRAQEHPTVHGSKTRALISAQQKGRVWVNDGETNRRLPPDEAEALLASGWLPGRKPRPEGAPHGNTGRKHTEEARERMGASKRGQPRSPEAIAKTAAANRGRKNDAEALANMKEAGLLRRGRPRSPEVVAQMRDKVWITDGTRNLRLSSAEASTYLDEGWIRGRASR